LLLLVILGLGYKIFHPEIIELKERYLVKRNYNKNLEVFNQTLNDFKDYQNISIDFAAGNYMYAFASGFQYLDSDSVDFTSLLEQGEIGQLKINDSIATIDYKNVQYAILSFKVDKSLIEIKLNSDSILVIESKWTIDYEGYCKSELFPELLNALRLGMDSLEDLKIKLRQRNCFGISNDKDKIILHFRSPQNLKLLVCSYSYCIFKNNESKDDFFDGTFDYGQLNENIYWYFNDAIQIISLFPGGYENRDI
jgi:hypothetical protein